MQEKKAKSDHGHGSDNPIEELNANTTESVVRAAAAVEGIRLEQCTVTMTAAQNTPDDKSPPKHNN